MQTQLDLSEPQRRDVGKGNALFLADLATGMPDDDMRAAFKDGRYANIHKASIPGWRALAGRK